MLIECHMIDVHVLYCILQCTYRMSLFVYSQTNNEYTYTFVFIWYLNLYKLLTFAPELSISFR